MNPNVIPEIMNSLYWPWLYCGITRAQKPAENASILDFCHNTEVRTSLLIPTGDKKNQQSTFYLLPSAHLLENYLSSYEMHYCI